MTYVLSKFPNFAHAEFISFGAYMTYALLMYFGLPLVPAVFISGLLSALLGGVSYLLLFKPLLRRGASLIHLMVASIGLGLIIRHCLMEIFGGDILSFRIFWPTLHLRVSLLGYDLGSLSTTPLWLSLIAFSALFSLSLHIFFTKTAFGKAIRATADNPELAMASGINTESVTLFTWCLGASLAGLAGTFLAIGTALVPLLGWKMLLPAFSVTVFGGIGSFYGALLASYILGFAESIGVVLLTNLGLSADYRTAISFAVLIITLIVRPSGIAGLTHRRA